MKTDPQYRVLWGHRLEHSVQDSTQTSGAFRNVWVGSWKNARCRWLPWHFRAYLAVNRPEPRGKFREMWELRLIGRSATDSLVLPASLTLDIECHAPTRTKALSRVIERLHGLSRVLGDLGHSS